MIAEGTPGQLEADRHSIMGPFLAGAIAVRRGRPVPDGQLGEITIEIGDLYDLHDLTVAIPLRRMTAVTGPSGAGKTALLLDSLVPAARALPTGSAPPGHVRRHGPGRHRPGGPDRRLADRPERAVHARDLFRGVRPDPPGLRRHRVRPAAALEAGALLFQHPRGQCPTCRAARQPAGTLYVFDEPSTGLHPLDVATLAGLFDRLRAVAGRAARPVAGPQPEAAS